MRNIGGVKPKGGRPGAVPVAGLAKRIISEGVRVYEVAFWDPTPTEGELLPLQALPSTANTSLALARTSRAPSCPEFIDVVDNYVRSSSRTRLATPQLTSTAFADPTFAPRTHRKRILGRDGSSAFPPLSLPSL